MKAYYSIGEVSKIMDISIKALRHYAEIGLLIPSYTDPKNNYRYYAYDQFFYIDLIRYLNKSLYVPLEDIKLMWNDNMNGEELLEFLEAHKSIIDSKIRKYQYSKDMLSRIINDIKSQHAKDKTGDIFEQYFLRRKVYYIEANVTHYDIDLYMKRNNVNLHCEENTADENLCYVYSCKQYLASHELLITKLGTISDREIPDMKYFILPEGRYLSSAFKYSEANSLQHFEKIYEYAKSRQNIISDTVLQTFKMIDLSAFSKYDYKMEIQVLRKDI